jgi:hypothetical protein
MHPQYGPWGYNFLHDYFFRVCHYYDADKQPQHDAGVLPAFV